MKILCKIGWVILMGGYPYVNKGGFSNNIFYVKGTLVGFANQLVMNEFE